MCMLKIFQIGISCLGNSHKHQNNIMHKKTSIKINNYLLCRLKYNVRRYSQNIFIMFHLPAAVVVVGTASLLLLLVQG